MNNKAYRSATLINELLENLHNQAAGLAEHGDLIDQFCTNMPDDTVTYVWAYKTQIGVQVKGDGTVLAMAMRFFQTRGWKLQGEKPVAKSAQWEGKYVHGELVSPPRVTLTWTSTLCKRVKVGTKTVTREEDVYETQCDDTVPENSDGDQDTSSGAEVAPEQESA